MVLFRFMGTPITPKNVRWRVYFTASWFLPWNFAGNRRIHVTFVSLSFISCRIYEKWYFIISSRGYITCPDRWPGSHVSAGYMTSRRQTQLMSRTSPEWYATILTWYAIQNQGNIATSPFGLVRAPTFIVLVREVGVSMSIFIIENWPISGSKYA